MSPAEELVVEAPPPPRLHLRGEPRVSVARGTLALTVYTDEPLHWARGGALELFRRFVGIVGVEPLRWFRSSVEPVWRPLVPNDLPYVEEGLTVGPTRGARHLLELRVVDDAGAESRGFTYREVHHGHEARTGYVQIVLPATTDPNELAQLALEIGHGHPFVAGVGGWTATWNRELPELAFNRMHAWCKRYMGLDVQRPDDMAWHVRSGLPGIGWLTLVGKPLLERFGISSLPTMTGVQTLELSRGFLVRAGDRPDLGDVNYMAQPVALLEAGRHLAPYLVEAPPTFPGGAFTSEDVADTLPWFRRLAEPSAWIR